jgi:hypothetical protein
MAIKICLQSGHWNKPGAGAPNEQATNKRITDRLADMLRQRGFAVTQTDYYGYNDPVVTKTDFKLFLALHCDMDYPNDNGSGFADFAEESLAGAGYIESQRICKIINETYFPEVKINYVNHSNANTKRYYMWKYLTSKTPCVLLEMGQSIDPHDSVLLGNTDLIAGGIARTLCKAFNVSYEIDSGTTSPVDPHLAEIENLKSDNLALTNDLKTAITDFEERLADKDSECLSKIVSYKEKIINFINSI